MMRLAHDGRYGGRIDPLTPPEILDAWARFKATGDVGARNKLVVHYESLAEVVARRLDPEMGSHVEHEDLVNYGIFGLVDALERFDPDRGLRFETYALTRIRGAVLDELRAIETWAPRSVRDRSRAIANTEALLAQSLGRHPSRGEVAERLGIDTGQVHKVLGDARAVSVRSLEEPHAVGEDSETTIGASLADSDADSDTDSVEAIREALAAAIAELDDRSRAVLALYYREELKLADCGTVLGVRTTRASQLLTAAVERLQELLIGDEGLSLASLGG